MSTLSFTSIPRPKSWGLDYAPRAFNAAQYLDHYADFCWHIQSGLIKTYCIQEDGYYTTTGYWGKGDIVGDRLQANHCEMLCITDVIAQCIPWEIDPDLLPTVIEQHARTQELLAIQGLKTIKHRIQHVFLWLANQFGEPTQQGCQIEVPMTHEAIAELIGTTRVTVTRALNIFTEQGLIKRSKYIYTLLPLALKTQNWCEFSD